MLSPLTFLSFLKGKHEKRKFSMYSQKACKVLPVCVLPHLLFYKELFHFHLFFLCDTLIFFNENQSYHGIVT
ncbi:hypothetical protein BDF20DRAFT_896067 [Mycotypha africana]|uniref:uncharacterized protein n=1 Tax=Mycotypha africana TaxID=64632 RepID=UPI0023006E57|nr:uncharacterized protein BDF20DRAFT_896067 [Mycotypha africana]KAI8968387.1 hypothetical protein BDF20DRAFT_896067 [Mycotypha africana]